ncbi:phospholipase A1-IIdelta-like [Rutidosis leptorrhynchoides]|uniref:phospholipase A1-IIdelta-like n=1 Tax=Rutidosis leptorrhynchoides TaxID=125765 RepID=UPI003A9928EA
MGSKSYDELHGSTNWAGLLDPLDLELRTLLVGYGDLLSATKRVFNNDEGSKYQGYSYYGKTVFFKKAMLPSADSKYQVAYFIYATSPGDAVLSLLSPGMSRDGSEFETNWMGYIAVSNDDYSKSIGRREICMVWRGTARTYEWNQDVFGAMPVSAEPLLPGVDVTGANTPQVMGGWLTIYTTNDPNSELVKSSARTQLTENIKKLLEKYKDEKVSITCTGHSLGACLATLSAFDIAINIVTPDINVSAFIFECPQVRNQSFKDEIEKLRNLKVLRVKNDRDVIPFWPSKIVKWVEEHIWVILPSELLVYVDVGVELWIDSNKSPYLKEENPIDGMLHPMVFHNLQCVLHTLSGWNGKEGEFDWSLMKRSLGLVNLSNDFLKEEYKLPANWWAVTNKGMVLSDDGDWVLSPLDPKDHDLPVY